LFGHGPVGWLEKLDIGGVQHCAFPLQCRRHLPNHAKYKTKQNPPLPKFHRLPRTSRGASAKHRRRASGHHKMLNGRLHQGTCGWGGKIYPPGTGLQLFLSFFFGGLSLWGEIWTPPCFLGSASPARLKYYSKYFPCVEIDTSCYAIPSIG